VGEPRQEGQSRLLKRDLGWGKGWRPDFGQLCGKERLVENPCKRANIQKSGIRDFRTYGRIGWFIAAIEPARKRENNQNGGEEEMKGGRVLLNAQIATKPRSKAGPASQSAIGSGVRGGRILVKYRIEKPDCN